MSASLFMPLALSIPLITAVLILLSHRRPNLREGCTMTGALALAFIVFSFALYYADNPRPLSFTLLPFLALDSAHAVALRFTLEPLGMIFAAVAAILWPINSLYSIGYMRSNRERHQTRFYFCFALAITSALGIAFAGNLLTLFVCYEMMTLSTYPLVTHKGTAEAKAGGRTYLGILLSTSIGLLLPAILIVFTLAGRLDFAPRGLLANTGLEGASVGLLLALAMYGIGKAALMPVHRWLPGAMVAPTPVSALLHAVAVVKAGVFCVVKLIVYVFGTDFLQSQPAANWLAYAAGFTIVAASLIALRQDNLKRRLAYSTISQLSYIVLAAALFTPAAITAAALHIAAHAFGKISLFFAAGSIYTAAHKTKVSELNGIGRRMPWTMAAFAVGSLSMIGVPPAAGLISKWYLLNGAIQAEHLFAVVVIVISTLLNTAYFVPIVYHAFFSPEDQPPEHPHREAPWPLVAALTATASLTVLLFFVPGVFHRLATALVELAL